MILTLSCPDRTGIVARVAALLYERGANILDAQQFDDAETGRFFMRVVFDLGEGDDLEALRSAFGELAAALAMDWSLRDPREKRRVMILASQTDHCLADLIWRWRQIRSEARAEPPGLSTRRTIALTALFSAASRMARTRVSEPTTSPPNSCAHTSQHLPRFGHIQALSQSCRRPA